MHIVQLIPELNQGGVENIVISLNRETIRKGHQSTVISAGGKLTEQIIKDGGNHITLDVCSKNPLSVPLRVHKLKTSLRNIAPDIIHAHSRVPAWLAWFANKGIKKPFITTVHGFNSVSRYSKIMTKGDQVICVSNPVKKYIENNYSPDPAKINTIHCGIDLTRFDPKKIDQQKIDNLKEQYQLHGKKVITSVGRITELKDYETFINAISIAIKTEPEIRALIVGHVRKDKEEYFKRLQEQVKTLNLTQHIHFIHNGPDMPQLYALSNTIVSCSKKPESFGLTLIESLAMNTPVIASHHGGPLDIIDEGINGHFFEKQDAKALAQLMISAQTEKTELRSDVLERFSIHKMIDSTLSVYKTAARHD